MLNVTWTEVNSMSSDSAHSRAMQSGPMWSKVLELAEAKAPGRPQAWLAERLGVKVQVVSNWSTRGVPAKHARQLSTILGCSVEELLNDSWVPELAPQQQPGDSREKMLADLMGWLPSLDQTLLHLTYAAVKNAVLSRPK